MSPIGLLRWCLQYASEPTGPTDAVFGIVKQQFKGVSSEIYKLVNRVNTFRNDYVAHQNKVLSDPTLARNALREWTTGLRQIWKLHS